MVTYPIILGREFDVIPDDTEESIVGSVIHQDAIVTAADGLRISAARRDLPWFVSNQQFLLLLNEGRPFPRRIGPDVCVYQSLPMVNPTSIPVAQHGPPTLILEVASPGTALANDTNIFDPQAKPRLYERIGVAEYIAFDPTGEIYGAPIWAQHRGPEGFMPWLPEGDGRLHSVLGISFMQVGHLLRVYDHDGQLVPISLEFDAMLNEERRQNEERARRIAALEAELRHLREGER